MTIELPQRIPLARCSTPLQRLDRVSQALGTEIWIKRDDLTGSVLSGNKVRKLEFLCAEAKNQGADVLLTCGGVQSNHCRATAFVAAQLGMKCHLLLREEPTGEFNGNLLLDHIAGATLSVYPKKEFAENLSSYFDYWQSEYRAKGLMAYGIPTGGSNAVGLCGYLACAQELKQDFIDHSIKPRAVFCATGSGGTQAGLTLGLSESSNHPIDIVGVAVCDNTAYFEKKVSEDLLAWQKKYGQDIDLKSLTIQTVDSYIGAGYGLADNKVFETIIRFAQLEGIVFDPVYTAKAFMGMLEEIKRRRFTQEDVAVFIHTGGTFGLFPYHKQIDKYLASQTN